MVIATGKYIGEGFDDSRLDTLFLTMPVSWRGIIAQYAGRLHRLHDGKREVRIHDYADLDVPMLSRMFDKRCAGYEAVGYSILLPASALPGWPATVPLPIDPVWKQDYAASVKRLIRDGVDVPLANLFVQATSRPADPDGIVRARSAAEAFLFRRLESLAETAGLFRLNVKLPIPFDGWSELEADLYCAEFKLVVEIDGPQHLSDRRPIAATGARTRCFRNTAAWCCGFWRRISPSTSMSRSTPSPAPSPACAATPNPSSVMIFPNIDAIASIFGDADGELVWPGIGITGKK